jgi:hypothetical protein
MKTPSYTTTLAALLETDFKLFKRTIHDKLIDLMIWVVTTVLITAYLLPYFGLDHSYTTLTIASLIGSAGLFEMYAATTYLIADFEGNNITAHYLTLPVPSWLIFLRNMIFYSFNTAILAVFVLPVSKLLLWNNFDLSQFSPLKFFIIFMLTNVFYSSFTVWVTSYTISIENISSVWMRFVYPLWTLGGFQYSYNILHDFSPTLARLNLLNPMIFVMEGTRGSILGESDTLNFWFCCLMLSLFTVLCGVHGIARLKKRLDFI